MVEYTVKVSTIYIVEIFALRKCDRCKNSLRHCESV